MELEDVVLERVKAYESLSRWEKSELGKELRRLGLSYGEIMDLIPVKKSTLATWCRGVKLTDEQIEAIKKRRAPDPGIPRNTNSKRLEEISVLRSIARSEVPSLFQDPLWLAGVILYWAEGTKTRNHVRMANTDPRALRLFVQWLRTYVQPSAEFAIQLHLHEGNDETAARAHWQDQTGLRDANFHKTFIKPKGTGHRNNRLPHGVCTVRMMKPSDAWNVIMEWIEGVTALLGLD